MQTTRLFPHPPTLTIFVGSLLLVLLQGACTSHTDIVRAEKLVLTDARDIPRLELAGSGDGGGPSIKMMDVHGTTKLSLWMRPFHDLHGGSTEANIIGLQVFPAGGGELLNISLSSNRLVLRCGGVDSAVLGAVIQDGALEIWSEPGNADVAGPAKQGDRIKVGISGDGTITTEKIRRND